MIERTLYIIQKKIINLLKGHRSRLKRKKNPKIWTKKANSNFEKGIRPLIPTVTTMSGQIYLTFCLSWNILMFWSTYWKPCVWHLSLHCNTLMNFLVSLQSCILNCQPIQFAWASETDTELKLTTENIEEG